MGLSGPKKRSKISRDPNNNSWSQSTDRFGHRILTSQGWTPGSTLGARDAAHAGHFTAGSASHIRILLRDDNLGLGASRAGGLKADTFGLAALQGLLGRLNGKSDGELRKEEGKQRDVQLARYQGQRWGHVQFVSGGYLVGDSIERNGKQVQSGKDADDEVGDTDSPALKSPKKRKRDTETQEGSGEADITKKIKKRRAREDESAVGRSQPESVTEERDEKQEKRHRKEERRRRKAEKQARKDARPVEDAQSASQSTEEAEDTPAPAASPSATEAIKSSEPAAARPPPAPFGRHAVRSRYIRSKQMASADPRALKEIFMIKTSS